MQEKPFSPACERNKVPLLEVLKPLLADSRHLLEIGSGTGQHAVFFGKSLPHIQWQTSDLKGMHDGITQWIREADLNNILMPLVLNVDEDPIPSHHFDVIFTANTFHIMGFDSVKNALRKIGEALEPGGKLIVYGPFKFDGEFTSKSNVDFDSMLKQRNPHQGIRDFEKIDGLASEAGMQHLKTISMPANNVLLVYEKTR